MREFSPTDYGPVLAQLVNGDRFRSLDAGRPERTVQSALEQASIEAAFAHARVVDREMAAACLAGAWLVHDFLEKSHTISQSVDTPTGAYWHGIMHRREGDFSNAKYWFRRVGQHEVLDELGVSVPELGGQFEPMAFVDACQEASRTGGVAEEFCRRAQQAEWQLLFDFSYRHAVRT